MEHLMELGGICQPTSYQLLPGVVGVMICSAVVMAQHHHPSIPLPLTKKCEEKDDDDDGNIEDNEQLANDIQESLKPELPLRNNYGNVFPPPPWSDSSPFCHSTVRLTSRERDLKSVHMESRHFHNDLYASLFQQSGSVETEGTRVKNYSSSVAHIQSITTHHLNTNPDAEKRSFL
ncbi:hypothetical protein Tco_1518566 [Tanacetum coccineum]